ncbi:MAG: AI-2E family transporter [Oscillospiraceae bacterium]|nr:AI-2E family transporter [Oscillospiraceae bacterium]
MKFKKLSQKQWYNGAVIACIGVAFYVLLTNFSTVMSAVSGFLGNFKVIILGIVFAYILNPLANLFSNKLLKKMKVGSRRWSLSVVLTVVTALLVLLFLIGALIPQLVTSVAAFSENIDDYAASAIRMLEGSFLERFLNADRLTTLSQNALSSIINFVKENAGRILSSAANSGRNVISAVISLILAIYLLMDKKRVLRGWWRLVRAFFSQNATMGIMDFSLRCDAILISFLVQSLLDSLIIGVVNAIFMLICRMQYIGLVSVVVAITNLIPNFGPIIGAVVGGFVLFLVNPLHALMFVAFCAVLQFADGYILKPKLFSSSLGVSGLLILVASIVLGNMFGIVGMVLSIPAAAILSFIYNDYLLPRQEQRRTRNEQS